MSNYIQHTANNRNFIIVEVPKDATFFRMHTRMHLIFELPNSHDIIELPDSDYRILFIAEEATEEQAMDVVEHHPIAKFLFKNYEFSPLGQSKATESLLSLICANFPDHLNHKHLILEQI